MTVKPRIKLKKRRGVFRPIWMCSAEDDKKTFRNTGTGITPQSAYAHWLYSNDLPF